MSDPSAALGAGQPAVITPLTEDDLLGVAARVLPEEYLAPLVANGPGYEILQAGAAVMARVSLAAARADAGLYFTSAQGGAFSSGSVRFTVGSAAAFGRTIKAGTVVRAPRGGQQYLTVEDGRISAFSVDPVDVQVRAVAPGWEYDVRGQRTTAGGELLPGEVSVIESVFLDPPASALDIAVQQVTDITGGRAPMLDMLAHDRAADRRPGETDPALASRARSLPDVVSPAAIKRILDRYLLPRGIWYQVVAWWETRWQLAYDVPPTTGTGKNPVGDVQAGDVFFYDDPREQRDKLWRNRWRDSTTQGGFVVVVPSLPATKSHALLYDDPRVSADDHVTAAGRAAIGAYDLLPPVQPTSLVPAYDGTDPGLRSVLGGLKAVLDAAVAGGYNAFLDLGVGGADPAALAAAKAALIAAGGGALV